MRKLIGIFGLLINGAVFSQPANDVCSGAVTLNDCPPAAPTVGTTVGANDNWSGAVGCQSANGHPEVWYTFTATGTLATFTITNITMTGNIEFILAIPNCMSNNCVCPFIIVNSTCGPSPLTVSVATTPGQIYYVTISSSTGVAGVGTFNICLDMSTPTPLPGQDCSTASILCDDAGFSQGSSAAGFGVQEVSPGNSCWGSGGERQSKWFKFSAGCTGTLEFKIDPNTNSNDYDFGVWNVTGDPSGCTTKGNTIACNWSGCTNNTGLSSCSNICTGEPANDCAPQPGCQASAYSAPVTLTAGNVYALLVDNFTTSNSGFALSFGGGCGGGTVVMGPDTAFTYSFAAGCTTITCTKTCVISPTTNNIYLWNMGDGNQYTTQNVTHTYALAGTYTITFQVTDLLGCVRTTSRTITTSSCLPIELLDLRADGNGQHIDVTWRTASETNCAYFIVERSTDGIGFEQITTVLAAGTTSQASDYRVTDKDPVPGMSYYRLKQVDTDGNSTYTHMVAAEHFSIPDFLIVPNPAFNNADILLPDGFAGHNFTLNITDVTGRIVLKEVHNAERRSSEENKVLVELSGLGKGVYMVYLCSGKKILKSRLMKQ